ncbi:MAG: sodium-dependent bicarbonate transport family permease, partial [Burkholderiaceae bacterium]|nr:sodium-dependent bicarbonate transport family permease [Burkholderiaceae bacterium]
MVDVVVLFFVLGVFARLVKSDLRLPEPLYETLSIYLLIAIGLKGGVELHRLPLAELMPQMVGSMALGFAIPFVLTPVLRGLGLSR